MSNCLIMWLCKTLICNGCPELSLCTSWQPSGKPCSLVLPCQGMTVQALCHDKLLCLVQAVIFIFEHSEQGSAGLILNRPTQYTIGSMPGLETLCPDFADNVLFLVCALRTSPSNAVKPQTGCRLGLAKIQGWLCVLTDTMLPNRLPLQRP